MTKPSVTVVDYGCGNLLSVRRALEHVGASVRVTSAAADIESADRLLLPGVGAFENGMKGLRELGLVESIRKYSILGRPMLGICLGMQMLASLSEEFGNHEGLGLIPGRVVSLPSLDVNGERLKIPHIGWSELMMATPRGWAGTMFEGTREGTSVYLVHSFHFEPNDVAHRLAECFYGGQRITAAVRSGRTIGCQFHPEKSGEAGLALLSAFLRL